MYELTVSGMFLGLLLLSPSDGVAIEKQSYSIELRVIVDSYAFNSWKGYIASSAAESDTTTGTRIAMKKYIKSSLNDVNSILNELSESRINVDARIVSIEFVKEKISYDNGGTADSSKILEELKEWLSTKNYPTVDHTVLFTGLDLTTDGNRRTAGVAYLGKMCDAQFSLSVVEAKPTGSVTLTIAHELGHSLSAKHDGNGNTCKTGNYIMKGGNLLRTASNKNFRFSECSVSYFSNFLADEKSTCLKHTTARKETAIPLGEAYTPDQMCQMVEGRESFACRSVYGEGQRAYSEICLNVLCTKPGENYCKSISSADGFVCGKDKMCSLGDCVDSIDVSTGSASDTCPLGDSPLPLENLGNETCSNAIASYPGHCYQNYTRRACCKSCQDAKSDEQDCVYGDHASWCSGLKKYLCYANAEVCCATCAKYANTTSNCTYGDGSPSCSGLENYLCYAGKNSHLCCATCANYETAKPACMYGDKAPWCSSMDVHNDCPLNKEVCCEKCNNTTVQHEEP